jgi:hypothetical protein
MTKQQIIAALLVVVGWLGSNYVVYHYSKEAGMLEGIKAYHAQCFEVGGYIISDTGEVVACKGQGVVPKEELKHFKSTI